MPLSRDSLGGHDPHVEKRCSKNLKKLLKNTNTNDDSEQQIAQSILAILR